MSPAVARGERSRSRDAAVRVSAGKPIDFPRCYLPAVRDACSRAGPLLGFRLPYDLARVGRAEPYLAHVAVVAEVVELLRVRVLPAAATERERERSEKRRVMHNGCRAVTVRITYNSSVPRSDDVNSSLVRSVIIPPRFRQSPIDVHGMMPDNADPAARTVSSDFRLRIEYSRSTDDGLIALS